MNAIILYDKYSTYTNTVYEHLSSFRKYSKFKHFYVHATDETPKIDWNLIDIIVIHYSLRVAHDQITLNLLGQIRRFKGLKILFVQDEYENTNKTYSAIKSLGISLVYTCVPEEHIQKIYPKENFPKVKFINTLTGFTIDKKSTSQKLPLIKDRSCLIGYRGRNLPYWYGDLGQEKIKIGEVMRVESIRRNLMVDISYDDDKRIYGDNWTNFIKKSKATLGTESGSNIFDFDGNIKKSFINFLKLNPTKDYKYVRNKLLGEKKELNIMNQISPRIFEAISLKSALILFEGKYSGVIKPFIHFIPLKKDFSNIDDVFNKLKDDNYLQLMVDRAFKDIILSGSYTYSSFISNYDKQINLLIEHSTSSIVTKKIINMDTKPERHRLIRMWPLLIKLKNLLPKKFVVIIKPMGIKLFYKLKHLIQIFKQKS